MTIELSVGRSCRVRHADEEAYQEHRVVRHCNKSYTFAKWLTSYKGAISVIEVPKEPADLLQITESPEGAEIVYVVSTGGGVLDRTPHMLDRLPESLRQNALKRHLDKFREFEKILDA
ncbi:MAG: hypothetical protein HYU56_04700 [Candidatus Aenigmarchaeota archaeon]|nr:hypothetical protein [Candidatus Aenigmarchaeota archaeon]